jgi:hypothetical protein
MVSSSASHVWLPEGIPYRFPSSGFIIGKKTYINHQLSKSFGEFGIHFYGIIDDSTRYCHVETV